MRFFQTCYLKCIVVVVHISILEIHGDKEVCRAQECQYTATSILNSMNPGINPCHDFYEYACGNFPFWKRSEFSPVVKSFGYKDIIIRQVEDRLRYVLEKTNARDSAVVKKAKKLYRSCLDTDAIDRAGLAPLIEIIDGFGGWPTMMDVRTYEASKIPWDVIHYNYNRQLGEGPLLTITVEPDPENKRVRHIVLEQPQTLNEIFRAINLPAAYPHYRKMLEDYTITVARVKNPYIDRNVVTVDTEDVLNFRKALYSIMNYAPEANETRIFFKIEELQIWAAQLVREGGKEINWLELFQQTFANTNGVTITGKTRILVKEYDYFRKLQKILARYPDRVIANHMHLYFVEKYGKNAGTAMRNVFGAFNRALTGNPLPPKTWRQCVKEHQMRHVLAKLYVEEFFSTPNSMQNTRNIYRDKVSELTARLQETMKRQIRRSSWLDQQTKQHAVAKMDHLQLVSGYHDWVTNARQLAAYYHNFFIGDVYLKNLMSCKQGGYAKDLEHIRRSQLSRPKTIDATSTNSFYHYEFNLVEILAGVLVWPHFGLQLPEVVTYAVTGTIISHEMAHAYDPNGRSYDANGDLRHWWSQASFATFENSTFCILDQFKEFPVGQAREFIVPENTIHEDFADQLGVDVAFEAYARSAELGKVTVLPGLENLSENKLFFLSYANKYCEFVNPTRIRSLIQSEKHSLPRLRVNGPLLNSAAFASEYRCALGTPMNPHKKCSIWA